MELTFLFQKFCYSLYSGSFPLCMGNCDLKYKALIVPVSVFSIQNLLHRIFVLLYLQRLHTFLRELRRSPIYLRVLQLLRPSSQFHAYLINLKHSIFQLFLLSFRLLVPYTQLELTSSKLSSLSLLTPILKPRNLQPT